MRFDGKVVVITGAAGSLGEAYARRFAAGGAQVVLNDVAAEPLARLAEELGGVATTDTVATPEGGEAIVRAALDAFGRIDVLVNNAGIARPNYLADLAWSDLADTFAVHLWGAFHLTKPAWAAMRDQGGGSIVNTTSAVGLFGQPRSSGYGAAKLGLVGMTRVLALEGEPHGIRVNAIAPVASSSMANDVYRGLTPKLDPDHVAVVVAALAHDSCALSGEVISAGGGRVARIVIGAYAGHFAEALDEDAAASYLAALPEETPSLPRSAMEEIDLIRVNYPELTEPMRYHAPGD